MLLFLSAALADDSPCWRTADGTLEPWIPEDEVSRVVAQGEVPP